MATSKELRDLTVEDLNRRAQEIRDGLFQDQLKMRTGSLESASQRTAKRRDLARVLGLITEKQRAAKATAQDKKA
ncbi:MAG: 50S ribosomal protein L29 [Myxococcota bacterium]|nr:50S ribosomal protein L29 [Myxococcota bacterium]